jgi:hypothetical protein
MAFLGGTFDASQVEPQGDYQPIPPGEYKVQITSSEVVENSAKTGRILKLELEITEGDQAGRKLFDRLNIDNPNAQAVEIAQRQLSAICHALYGVRKTHSVSDSEELHMIPMVAVVKVDPPRTANGREYGASNSVKTYKAVGGAAPAASGGFRPSAAKPAAAAGGGAPWKRTAA